MEEPIDSILTQNPLISHFEKLQKNGDGYRYSIFLKSAEPNFSDLFQSLKQQTIQNVVIPEPSLEDYFLQYYKED